MGSAFGGGKSMAVILIAAAVFLFLILYIAVEQDKREKFTGIAFFLATVGGIVIYGLSYSIEGKDIWADAAGVLQTLVDVGRMFVGMNNLSVFKQMLIDKGMENDAWYFLFWIVHFLAYYSMASAAILTLGKGAARKVQLWLLNVRDVELIYGITDISLAMGRHIASDPHVSVVFVGQASSAQEIAIRQMKALLLTDDVAMIPEEGLLKRISVTERKGRLKLFAISDDGEDNYNYALRLMRLLEKEKVKPSRTTLILLGREERHGGILQAGRSHYGYGEVQIYDESELTSRMLIRKFPPCNALSFDENGVAERDMKVLLLGFGVSGQEVLKKLIANGQFEGSNFSVDVFDPEYGRRDGFYRERYSSMLKNYDINFHQYGGRSREFCDYLKENARTLTYLVIAIDNIPLSRKLAEEIMEFLAKYGVILPVYVCCDGTVSCYRLHEESISYSLHDMGNLFGGDMDMRAMQINHFYNDPAGSSREQWLEADYFSRMSCRASADFLYSYLKRVGALEGEEISYEKLEILSKTEHLRWSAFHYSMGYSAMTVEEWNERASEYKKQVAAGEKKLIKIGKNTDDHRHACLVTWDELDELSERENNITGGNVDYKQFDRDNILAMVELLKH